MQSNVIGRWESPDICHGLTGLEPSVEHVGIFVNDDGLMDGDESSMEGKDKRWWDILEWAQRHRRLSLYVLHCHCTCEFVCVCVCTSKAKCRWLCQGWVITVVFSALQGGSDGCDGWLAVWPLLHASLQSSVWRSGLEWRAKGTGLLRDWG